MTNDSEYICDCMAGNALAVGWKMRMTLLPKLPSRLSVDNWNWNCFFTDPWYKITPPNPFPSISSKAFNCSYRERKAFEAQRAVTNPTAARPAGVEAVCVNIVWHEVMLQRLVKLPGNTRYQRTQGSESHSRWATQSGHGRNSIAEAPSTHSSITKRASQVASELQLVS